LGVRLFTHPEVISLPEEQDLTPFSEKIGDFDEGVFLWIEIFGVAGA
jgi:hypothetical protein